MAEVPKPSNWPQIPTEFFGANNVAAQWHWDRLCAEMDRRGHLQQADVFILQLTVEQVVSRDELVAEMQTVPAESQPAYQELISETNERITHYMDRCMLPPDFCKTVRPVA